MWAVLSSVLLAWAASGPAPMPDFSGSWTFHAAKSAQMTNAAKAHSASLVFGEACVITQTADTLTLDITAGALKIQAVYRLDGKPSINKSPGQAGQPDITIVSTTQWVGDVLHITTKSESVLDGATVPVESVRKLWLTPEGDLAVERRGNPTRVVSNAWTVYERKKIP